MNDQKKKKKKKNTLVTIVISCNTEFTRRRRGIVGDSFCGGESFRTHLDKRALRVCFTRVDFVWKFSAKRISKSFYKCREPGISY